MLPHSSTLGPITPEAAVAWFKGSRVVDENGAPLVVYRGEHGLLEGGATGLQSRSGSFTFGTAQAASLYANEPNDRANDFEALQPRVFPALLHISNPLVESQDDPFIDFSRLREVLGDDQARRIAIKFSGHIENTGNWQENFAEQHPDIDLYLKDASGEALDDLYMVLFPILDDPVEVALLQAAGFDGAIYGGSGETAVEPEYRVFSEKQVGYPLSIGWPAAPVAAPAESFLPERPAHQVAEQPVPQAEYQPSSIKMVRDAIAELIGPGAVRLSEGLGRLVVTTSRELRASPQFPDGHYQLGNEVLSSFAADDGFQRMLAEQRAAKRRAIEAIGDVGDCAIARQASGADRWQMILRDASEPGKWRTQSFDRKGFSGHMVYATRDQAIEAAAMSGFTVRDDLALDRIQGTPEFQRGLFATDLIGKVNAGVLTFEAANEKLAEYDRIEAARQSLSMSQAQAFITQDTIYLLADHIEAGDEKSVYLHEVTHRHGRSALGPHGWNHVVGTLKSWAHRPQGSVERSIHDAARQRALDGSRGRADVFDEELFAYSVEEAVSRGITPRAGAHPESAQAWLDDVVGMLRGLVHQMMGKEVNVLSSPQDLVDMAYALAQIENPARMQRVLQCMSLQEQAVLRRMMDGALHAPAHPELSTHVLLHVAQPMMAIQWAEWVRSQATQAPEVLAGQIATSNVLAWLQDQPEERMLGAQDVVSYLDTLQKEVGSSAPVAGVAVDPDALLEAPGPFTDWLLDQRKAAFARWTDDLPVVGEHEYPSTYLGGAAVFEVFHGTTHTDITEFKRQGHATGFLGKGPYFSTSSSDVSINYAGVGPDATTNLGLLSEDIERNGDQDAGAAAEFLISYFKAAGLSQEVDDDNVIALWEEHREAAAQHHARISLLGDSDGLMMKAFVKLQRPLDTLYGEMIYERTFDEDSGDLMDEQGTLVDWILAARKVGHRLDNSEKMESYIDSCLSAVEGEGVISVEEIFSLALRDLDGLYDEDELVAPGGVVSMIAEEAGYDGIVMDAWKHFGRRPSGPRIVVGGMEGLREETLHVLPFAPGQVKSATGNRGTFDPNSPDIRMSEVADAAVSDAQTDSPEFAAWFKDSKVVDPDGKPLVRFHATFADFNEFDRSKSFDGSFHFGSIAAANRRNEYWLKGATEEAQPNIMPVYLSIQNPAVLAYDPGEPEEWIEVIEQAAEAGHDGIVYRNDFEDKGVDSWVAFFPHQIKSATGNRGTFDPNSPDIRYSQTVAAAAKPEPAFKPEFRDWFEGSHVVDAAGRPLQVFHGSPSPGEIGEFEVHDGGIYFSSNPKVAEDYTARRGMWRSAKTGAVTSAYVALKNPLVIDALGKRHDNIPVPWQPWQPKVFGNLPKNAVNVQAALEHAIAQGHDGLIVRNVVDTADTQDTQKSDVVVATSADQIKPAAAAMASTQTTSAFDDWFQDSKVVDSAGMPLVVYHGTKADFTTYDIRMFGASDEGLAGRGFYFSSNPEEASGYALNEHFGKGDAPNVQAVHVALKDPLVITQGVLPDGRQLSDVHGGVSINSKGGAAVRSLAENGGHDGVMWIGSDGAVRHVVAFRPEQIKSAIGNQGTYDASNPDIRYSKRATEAKEFKTWFGSSKATENGRVGGEPLTLYHGTSTSFTEFTPSVQAFYGGGIYLTDNLESAQVFADGSAGAEDPRVLEVFARMERPYEFEAGYAIEEPTNASLVKKIFKGARRKSVLKTLDEQGELTDEISDELQAQGYDGLIVRVPGEPAEFVVFEPTQVKSATDNTGGFDASNPDIRYSQAKVKEPTQAPEASFIDWFQKSKVVDTKGTPLVVYHGSPDATFNSFDPERAGAATKSRDARAGFFFSDDKDFASHFTERRVFDSLTGQRIPTRSFGAAGIKDVYLSLQNPLDLRKVSPEVARAVAATKAMGRYATPEEIMALGRSAAGSKEIQENLAHARTELEALGYDGIINKVKHQGRVRTEFIAFKPEQIKSASANRGTFDPSNSDIRFSQVRPTHEPNLDFMEFLQRCQDGHEAGFHFEEGGCWGMALALQEQVGGQLMVRDGFVHAYVLLNGTLYDWQGEAQWIEGLRALTMDEFYVEAVANGVSREEVDADKDWALRIIDGAREWASERAAIKAKHNAAIAAGFFEAPADTDYSMAQIFPEPLREWFGASRVTVDGQQGGAPLLVFRGASEGDVDMGGIDPVGGLAAQPMDVFWATSSRENASFFAEDEIQNLYIRLENPLVLRSANPSPAVVASRILAEVRAGRANWDGVIFEDIVDGSHPSVVYAVFPKERSVRERIRIVGRTRYAPDGTPIHEGLMPSADPVEFTRGDVIRHDDTTDTEDESPASVVMRARA